MLGTGIFLLFCFVFYRLCSVFCFTHIILDACEGLGIKYLFVSSCTLKLSVNMNMSLSLNITSLKWISVDFFVAACVYRADPQSSFLSKRSAYTTVTITVVSGHLWLVLPECHRCSARLGVFSWGQFWDVAGR